MKRLALLFACAGSGCVDPVHSNAIDALGPEAPGVRHGPLHRPGQPCLVCHGGDGPGSPDMSVAGTVYDGVSSTHAVPNAVVRVVGADGHGYEALTNCAGNFWAPVDDFSLVFPANMSVTTARGQRVMLTESHRSGSCSDCHSATPSFTSPGRVWVTGAPTPTCDTGWAGGHVFQTAACDTTSPACPTTPSYSNEVAAILAARCTACHGPGGQAETKDFTTAAGIAAQARTAQQQLLSCKMPPPPLAPPSEDERTKLLCWLAQGAKDN